MRLDNEPLMRQGIIQGLRPEIKRDVLIQRPETLEALAEAAAIGEANARAANSTASRTDAAVTAQLAEMHAMITAMQSAVISGHRQRAEVNTVDARTTFVPSPANANRGRGGRRGRGRPEPWRSMSCARHESLIGLFSGIFRHIALYSPMESIGE